VAQQLGDKVELSGVFESLQQSNTRQCDFLRVIVVAQLAQRVLLHDDVCFLPQTLDLLQLAHLEGKVHLIRQLVMLNLKHFGEIAVTKLLDRLKIVDFQ